MSAYPPPGGFMPPFMGVGMAGMPTMRPDMGAGGIPRPEMGIGLAADIDQTKAKHSTVFVGNITDIFPDNLVRDLLSRCGKVLKWSRISATGSDNLPPFGFCTFATQDETLRCIRLLDGKEFGEKKLKIKVDDETRKYLDDYIKERQSVRADVDEEGLDDSSRQEDMRRRQQVETLVSKLNLEYSESIARLKAKMERRSDGFIRQEGETAMQAAMRRAKEYKSKLLERERSRRMNQLQDRERQALNREKQFRKDIIRFEEREAEREKEVKQRSVRQKEFERTYYDEKDDDKYFRSSVMSKLRDEARRESEQDEQDRRREEDEKVEDEKARIQAEENARIEAQKQKEKELLEAEMQAEADKQAAIDAQKRAELQAIHAVEEEKRRKEEELRAEEERKLQPTTLGARNSSGFGIKLDNLANSGKRSTTQTEMFKQADEEDDDEHGSSRKRSKIIPLTYTDEQLRNAGLNPELERKKRQRDIVTSIPTEKDALYSYVIEWELLSEGDMQQRVLPWISKKLFEFVGDNAEDLAQFVIDKLTAQSKPKELVTELAEIIDEDAELFVIKLWRFLIYESQARKFGLIQPAQ